MAIETISASGASTSAGSANLTRIWAVSASGASTSAGSAVLYIIRDLRVTQAGVQIDISRTTPIRVTQAGAQIDVERIVPQRVTQAGAQIDVIRVVPQRVTQAGVQIDVGRVVPQRVTQAGVQVDGRFRRPRTTVNCLEVHVTDRAGTYLAYLDNAFNVGYFAVLSDTGSGAFEIPSGDAKATATNIAVGNIVLVRYQNVDVGAWVMEEISEIVVGDGEEATEITQVSGRGVLALLDKALVYPTDLGDATTVERSWSATPKGEIFLDLHDEFVSRGGGDLSPSFTDSLDTGLNAWTDSNDISFKAGQTLLQVARRLAALGEFELLCDPDRTLNGYKAAGTDRSATVIFRQGLNIFSCSRRLGGRDIANVVLGEGQGVLAEDTDATSISAYGRREAYLPVLNTDQSAQVQVATDLLLTAYADPTTTASIQIIVDDDPAPFIDYQVGDTVQVEVLGEISAGYRVLSIALKEAQGNCDLQVALELNSLAAEHIARMQRAFEASTLGIQPGQGATSGLASDTTSPIASSDGGGIDNDAIKKRHVDFGTGATQVNQADLPYPTASKASDYPVVAGDSVILVDASGGPVTVTLPAAAASAGMLIAVKKVDSGGSAVTVDGNGAETIDGAANVSLAAQYDSVMVVCDATSWHILAQV